eukprot:3329525-Amphidinium_carterae.1
MPCMTSLMFQALGIGAVRAGRGDCSDRPVHPYASNYPKVRCNALSFCKNPIRCATTSLVVIVGLVFCAPAACIVGARRPYSWTSLCAIRYVSKGNSRAQFVRVFLWQCHA